MRGTPSLTQWNRVQSNRVVFESFVLKRRYRNSLRSMRIEFVLWCCYLKRFLYGNCNLTLPTKTRCCLNISDYIRSRIMFSLNAREFFIDLMCAINQRFDPACAMLYYTMLLCRISCHVNTARHIRLSSPWEQLIG